MTHKCNYCKQVKRCRENKVIFNGGTGLLRHNYISTEWICRDCDKYFSYKHREAEKQSKIDKEKRLKDFIINRDKVLKNLKFNVEVVKGGNSKDE